MVVLKGGTLRLVVRVDDSEFDLATNMKVHWRKGPHNTGDLYFDHIENLRVALEINQNIAVAGALTQNRESLRQSI